jgi:hypothetical protein
MANGNGTAKQIYVGIAITLAAGIIGFTAYRVFIHTPECYATKAEVYEIKRDINDTLKDINRKLDRYIFKHKEEE